MIISSTNKLTNKNKSKNLYYYNVIDNIPIYINRLEILGFSTGISFKSDEIICDSIGIFTQGERKKLVATYSYDFNGYYGIGIMINSSYKLL